MTEGGGNIPHPLHAPSVRHWFHFTDILSECSWSDKTNIELMSFVCCVHSLYDLARSTSIHAVVRSTPRLHNDIPAAMAAQWKEDNQEK